MPWTKAPVVNTVGAHGAEVLTTLLLASMLSTAEAQNPAAGLTAGDLTARPITDEPLPGYLNTYEDEAFGTTIRQITDVDPGETIKSMYSTVAAWNADETLLILYERGRGHRLHDGFSYEFLRYLDDVDPEDIEQIFWSHEDADVFFYLDNDTREYRSYRVSEKRDSTIVDLASICEGAVVEMGSDVQMISRDDDVFGFRCGSSDGYLYRVSTGELTRIDLPDVRELAPMPTASGDGAFHFAQMYDADDGSLRYDLEKEQKSEHANLGTLANGHDALFTVAFDFPRGGGCLGTVLAHDLETGECIEIVSRDVGYPGNVRTGVHFSALAHKAEPGWLAVSIVGDPDNIGLLDQELLLVRAATGGNSEVYRIAHHRADEEEVDYFGEPHPVISPSGTRVLFSSDWSGEADPGGTEVAINSFVVELPAFTNNPLPVEVTGFAAGADDEGLITATWRAEDVSDLERFELLVAPEAGGDTSVVEVARSTTGPDYSASAGPFAPGTYLVALRIRELDGVSSQLPWAVVELNAGTSEVRVVSPPGADDLRIVAEADGAPLRLEVYDALGRRLHSAPYAGQAVDVAGWPEGAYAVTLWNGRHVVGRARWVR